MQDELAAIDLSPLEELTGIQQELEVLAGRLQRMDERKDKVAAAVFERVRADYEGQRATLEQRAEPLRSAARGEYARLSGLLERCETEHAAVELDREEIELRFALGEFDEDEHRKRLKAIDARLKEKNAAREKAQQLRSRFITAFGSEQALEAPAAEDAATTGRHPVLEPSGTSTAAPAVDATQPLPTLKESAPPVQPEKPAPVGATQVMRALKGTESAPLRPDQTVILRTARLVPQNAEAGRQNVTLALKPMCIGSDNDSDVRVAGAAARHCEIRVSMAGFTITDLGGGMRVNGVPLEQHLLRHDDVIEIGPAQFAFREG